MFLKLSNQTFLALCRDTHSLLPWKIASSWSTQFNSSQDIPVYDYIILLIPSKAKKLILMDHKSFWCLIDSQSAGWMDAIDGDIEEIIAKSNYSNYSQAQRAF